VDVAATSPEPVTEPATSEAGTLEPSGEPTAAPPSSGKAASPSPEAPPLASLADRALAIMNRALGGAPSQSNALPDRKSY
jgi:hypothetical protein